MEPITLVELMFLHFFSDFVLQSNWMATNKSKSQKALMIHCTIYGLPFLIFGSVSFVCYLIITHYFVDFVTSRITSKLFKEWYDYQITDVKSGPIKTMETAMGIEPPTLHNFFVVIGFDQFLHFFILMAGAFFYEILR